MTKKKDKDKIKDNNKIKIKSNDIINQCNNIVIASPFRGVAIPLSLMAWTVSLYPYQWDSHGAKAPRNDNEYENYINRHLL